jgi:hypothetical protein
LIVHADNARPLTAAASQQSMEENVMTRTPYHLTFISSVRWSTTWGNNHSRRPMNFSGHGGGFEGCWKIDFGWGFLEWIQRLRRYIATNNYYVE